jgi:alkanesulfonate monooxygenase SsuD/methylene tetrahydromethanopterin reductase-like flavin-dependent oxidoreductase (luciferase family)
MRFSINLPNFGDFADPRRVVEVAVAAEEAGWDGVFIWDHVTYRKSEHRVVADPWILLAAAGMGTRRILLGPMVTPVARRRPGKLAREITSLDHLTGGRTVFGAGLGSMVDDEFGRFGDPTDLKVLAGRLDEGLAAIDLLWTGEPVTYRGTHVTLDDVQFLPRPVQRPRIPVWLAGRWPNRAPLRRAARWDGAVPLFPGYQTQRPPPVEEVRAAAQLLREFRTAAGRDGQGFDLVVGGRTAPEDKDLMAEFAAAGATWWDERMPYDDRLDKAEPYLRRIELGPPR